MAVAVITGAAQGIGQRTAEVLAGRGFELALFDLQAAPATSANARKLGREVLEFSGNVAEENSVNTFADSVRQRWGAADVVVNNAGIALIRPAESTTAEQFRRVLEINLLGPFLVAKALAPAMLERKSGSIVNVASIAGLA